MAAGADRFAGLDKGARVTRVTRGRARPFATWAAWFDAVRLRSRWHARVRALPLFAFLLLQGAGIGCRPAEAAALNTDAPPPTYRTRVPSTALMRYDLRRGILSGEGELRWQQDGRNYELRLQGTVLGMTVLSQTSRGGFDADGLAPERFTDHRRAREPRIADFRRDEKRIVYSGTEVQHPLPAGAQDRLSWLLQLAAIVEAEPARWRAGTHIEMAVTGARGDMDVWTFTVTGEEAIELIGTRLARALALRREPRKPFDTRVEVWLDPARQHLPVRMHLGSGRSDETLEFVLRP